MDKVAMFNMSDTELRVFVHGQTFEDHEEVCFKQINLKKVKFE